MFGKQGRIDERLLPGVAQKVSVKSKHRNGFSMQAGSLPRSQSWALEAIQTVIKKKIEK